MINKLFWILSETDRYIRDVLPFIPFLRAVSLSPFRLRSYCRVQVFGMSLPLVPSTTIPSSSFSPVRWKVDQVEKEWSTLPASIPPSHTARSSSCTPNLFPQVFLLYPPTIQYNRKKERNCYSAKSLLLLFFNLLGFLVIPHIPSFSVQTTFWALECKIPPPPPSLHLMCHQDFLTSSHHLHCLIWFSCSSYVCILLSHCFLRKLAKPLSPFFSFSFLTLAAQHSVPVILFNVYPFCHMLHRQRQANYIMLQMITAFPPPELTQSVILAIGAALYNELGTLGAMLCSTCLIFDQRRMRNAKCDSIFSSLLSTWFFKSLHETDTSPSDSITRTKDIPVICINFSVICSTSTLWPTITTDDRPPTDRHNGQISQWLWYIIMTTTIQESSFSAGCRSSHAT